MFTIIVELLYLPCKLLLQRSLEMCIRDRVYTNFTGNQNIPSRATGANLDALSEWYFPTTRPMAQPAVCLSLIHIYALQEERKAARDKAKAQTGNRKVPIHRIRRRYHGN